jgi:hypothetical protein
MNKIKFNNLYLTAESVEKTAQLVSMAAAQVNRIFVIDCSGSMCRDLPLIREQLKNKIPTLLNENDSVSIIWFSGRNQCGILQEGVKVKSVTDLELLNKSIDRWLKDVCLTGFKEPIELTTELIGRLEKKYPGSISTMTFMTDGYDNQWSEKEIIDVVTKLAEVAASVTFVEYGWYCNRNLMNKMAEATCGTLLFNENFYEYDELVSNEFNKKITDKAKIEVKIVNPTSKIVYGLTDDDEFITFACDDNNSIFVGSNVKAVYYFSEALKSNIAVDVAELSNNHPIISDTYRILSCLTQKMKSDEIFEILKSIGDIHLYKKFTNCFSKQDYTYFQRDCIEAANGHSFIEGRNTAFIPKDDAYTVIDVLDQLAADYNNKVLIYHDAFDYKKISTNKKQTSSAPAIDKDAIIEKIKNAKNATELAEASALLNEAATAPSNELKFVPEEDAKKNGLSVMKLTYNENRPNISILVKVNGTINITGQSGKPAGLPDEIPTFIYRNYAIINDGIKNVKKLPVVLSEETRKIFNDNHVPLMDVIEDSFEYSVIDIQNMPIINRKMVTTLSAKDFFTKNIELLKNSALQKVLKYYNDQYNEKRSTGYDVLYGVDASNWLKEIGITEYNGFSPKMETVEPVDEYIGKSMSVSIKGCSTLPTVKKVIEKVESGKGTLTKTECLINEGLKVYNEFTNSSIYQKSSNQTNLISTWLKDETKSAIENNRKLIREVSGMKFSVMLGHVWFNEFATLDENSMVVTVDGEDFDCTVELKDITIKI